MYSNRRPKQKRWRCSIRNKELLVQRRCRWIFLLMGCALGITGSFRLFRADYVGMLTLIVAAFYFWSAYLPPQIRSRVWQWMIYLLGVSAVIVIASGVYEFFA